jgi:DNA-binding NtrC family response regulator
MALAAESVREAAAANNASVAAHAAAGAAFAHLAAGDREAVRRDVSSCIQYARAAHDPLCALKARLLAGESERRYGCTAVASGILVRIRRLGGSLPPLVRARAALLGDLIAGGDPAELIRRHTAGSGLAGLSLFAPSADAHAAPGVAAALGEVVEILRLSQTSDDDADILAQVCSRLRRRLRAAGVTFFVADGDSVAPIAFDGSRVEPQIAARVVDSGLALTPQPRDGALEAGAPVRLSGDVVGVLAVRWTIGAAAEASAALPLLVMGATAAAPALAGVVARRRRHTPAAGDLVGISPAVEGVRRAVERAAAAPFPVLIDGESGSGKEIVAKALHRRSARRDRPFCTLNCAALPDDLVEAELFGHARGAFTGAVLERAGVFEEAHTGTLFLDEVGELSPRAQAKLLRTIQEGEVRRVGENISRRVDVRLVAATNRDLRREVKEGRFRLDLFYRLDVLRITIPPLRDRPEDIAVLVEHIWRDAVQRVGSRAVLSTATIAALSRYHWPGNVRELQNVLASLAVRGPRRGAIAPNALPACFEANATPDSWKLDTARRFFEEQFVRAALVRTGGHRSRAAEELGLTRQGLTKLMARLGIQESTATYGAAPPQ